jgi:hypothetical protein
LKNRGAQRSELESDVRLQPTSSNEILEFSEWKPHSNDHQIALQ